MSRQSSAAVVPEILYQNDVGREPVTLLQLAENQAMRVIPLPVPRAKSGAELLPSFETLGMIERLSDYVISSGQFKKRFTNKAQVVVTLLKGHDLGISFADALEHVYVVNGKPGVSGQLMLRLIYSRVRNPNSEPLVEFSEVGVEKATVRMRRPGQEWVERSFTIAEAATAGLLYHWKGDGDDRKKVENFVWHAYRQDMLLWRAVARCARIVFSDAIGGVYFYDELMSGPLNDPNAVLPGHDEPVIRPKDDTASSGNGAKKTSKKTSKKKSKNGLTAEQRDALQKSLHEATLHMDPDWPDGIPKSQQARFKKTRTMVYEAACQTALEFVPDHIEPAQAELVGVVLNGRTAKWLPVLGAVQMLAQVARPDKIQEGRREIWTAAWKAEAASKPTPKALAAADASLADKMLAGLKQSHERLKAQKKDGEGD